MAGGKLNLILRAAAALLLAGAGDAALAATKAPAAPARDWTKVVAGTPEGGFRIGNPDAKVKLIEYASVWCPHCRHFYVTGVGPLKAKYIATGKVSYEVRNFVLNPMDLPATLLVRCGGLPAYFKMLDAFYARQEEWEKPIIDQLTADPSALDKFSDLDPAKTSLAVARWAKLDAFAKTLGFTDAKFAACVSDAKAIDGVADANNVAVTKYDLKATPTFVINDVTLENVNTWEELEPKLRAAL